MSLFWLIGRELRTAPIYRSCLIILTEDIIGDKLNLEYFKEKDMKSELFQKLSLMEILMVIILFSPSPLFSETDIYNIFSKQYLKKRFRREDIRNALSFAEMGQLLAIRSFDGGNTFYRRNDEMLDFIRNELRDRKVLPKNQNTLQKCANQLNKNRRKAH